MKDKNIELRVDGMTCTNCAASLQKFLERKGMEEVYVNFSTKEVRYKHSNEAVPFEKVKEGIHKLGFEVVEAEGSGKKFWTLTKRVIIGLIFTLPLLFSHIFMVLGIEILSFLEAPMVQFALCVPVFIIGVEYFGKSAWGSLKGGVPNMDVLIFLGSTAAFIYSLIGLILQEPNYIFFETSATIITLVLIGNWLEERAVEKTTSAIEELTRLQPKKAFKVMPSGTVIKLDYEEIQKGDLLQVNEGDTIPADGKIIQGEAAVDESMITGESVPVDHQKGGQVIGGTLLKKGNLQVEVTAIGRNATLGQMIELVKSAQQDKPKLQRLADKISAIFVPVVVGIALLTLVISWLVVGIPFSKALMNSIAVLVISCPCALGLATPTAVMVGVGLLAKSGILIKGGQTLELFSKIKNFVFDKTGTLTTGNFSIKHIQYHEGDEKSIAPLLMGLEKHSSHPIAQSLVHSLGKHTQLVPVAFDRVEELKGAGVKGRRNGGPEYTIGSYQLAKDITENTSHDLYFRDDKQLLATIDIEDEIRPHAKALIQYLKKKGNHPILLSGDKEEKVSQVAEYLGISQYYSAQKPEQKLAKIQELSSQQPTAMIGDGINDAPALARADLGISLSGGTQAAIQSAQVVVLDGHLGKLIKALKISDRTLLTIKQNLFWAFAYNIVAIPIAAAGYLNPMWAALFMAFSDVVVVGNSLRLRRMN